VVRQPKGDGHTPSPSPFQYPAAPPSMLVSLTIGVYYAPARARRVAYVHSKRGRTPLSNRVPERTYRGADGRRNGAGPLPVG
jgi:hypothetical protein